MCAGVSIGIHAVSPLVGFPCRCCFCCAFRGGALWCCLTRNYLVLRLLRHYAYNIWYMTYLFFGGRWRCCCLCVLFMHDMQHTCAPSFSSVVSSFACYGVVVFPMRVGLYCLVVYLWYVFTVVRFVTYLFSPCPPLTALCLFRWFLALRGI